MTGEFNSSRRGWRITRRSAIKVSEPETVAWFQRGGGDAANVLIPVSQHHMVLSAQWQWWPCRAGG